jgi:hypothetical protein
MELSEIDWGTSRANLVAVVCSIAYPVFHFFSVSGPTKRARFKSYSKVVRQIRLALYCALGARRVDLVGSGDLEGQV